MTQLNLAKSKLVIKIEVRLIWELESWAKKFPSTKQWRCTKEVVFWRFVLPGCQSCCEWCSGLAFALESKFKFEVEHKIDWDCSNALFFFPSEIGEISVYFLWAFYLKVSITYMQSIKRIHDEKLLKKDRVLHLRLWIYVGWHTNQQMENAHR